MEMAKTTRRSIARDGLISVGIYILPVGLMLLVLPALTLAVGVAEFFLGLYDKRWTRNEKLLDAVCFVGSKLLVRPFVVYFTLRALPVLFPG